MQLSLDEIRRQCIDKDTKLEQFHATLEQLQVRYTGTLLSNDGVVMQLAGCQTCDPQVSGSSVSWAPLYGEHSQVICTYVLLYSVVLA